MHKHRTPERLGEHALLDRGVLNLMLDADRQRPRSEEEISRALSVPGDIRESLRRLRACKLIHRWNDLAIAAHPAVRFCEITHGTDTNPDDSRQRHDDRGVLEELLANSSEGPRTEQQIFDAHAARKRKQRVAITDALDRLDAAGLIDRRGGRAVASDVALRLDELMSL
jgi:hypothetical protein